MRKKTAILCLLTALLMLAAGFAEAETGVVTASKLMLREEANAESKPLQTLPNGTQLEIIGKSGEWYKVTYGKFTGYVYAQYVSLNPTADKEEDLQSQTLRQGDKSDAVKKLQQRLKELGYFDDECIGTFGKVTKAAVEAFQKQNGLTVDGIAGERTLNKLYSTSAKKASAAETTSVLNIGSRGDEVTKLQKMLKKLGYTNSVTGYYGNITKDAVKAFQSKNSLTANGVANSATVKKITAAYEKADEIVKVDGLTIGSRGNDVTDLQKMLKKLGFTSSVTGYFGTTTEGAVKEFQEKNGLTANGIANDATVKKITAAYDKALDNEKPDGLTLGSSGNDVTELQKMLKKLGYTDSVTGYFGTTTEGAVKSFQKKNSLTADGVATSATVKKIKAAYDKAIAAEKVDGLTIGDRGDEVTDLQKKLKKLGYTNSVTGYFGTTTEGAVKEFQKKNGLKETGAANSTTVNKITTAYNKAIETEEKTGLSVGQSGNAVTDLQKMLKELGYTDSVTGYYGVTTASAVKEFQKKTGLTANGIANDATVKKIKDAYNLLQKTKLKTEKLDWFKNGKATFAGRPIIQVKDVRTGLVFNAKVLYGTNHLDVEPLTAADTAILLQINGGEFSWRRRPMLVKHNGHVYAASIYSEPHGQQTIYNNNFDGQFCLHFFGSKTHGTDEVKRDHQEAVAEAMNATW